MLGIIFGIDFSVEDNVIYYGDRDNSTIWSVSINRISDIQDDRTLLVSNTTVWDITYDWINHYLYWTNDK